jgi:competence protein ComEA
MTLYTRHQLLLMLLLVVAAGAGLAIDHWRHARPDVVDRLERLDRVERPAAAAAVRREPRRASGDGAVRPPRERVSRPRAERTPRGARAPAATPESPLDVNGASAPELARLPGIGPTLAARIVGARPFSAVDELARVPGLRPSTLERVRPRLTLLPWP